MSIHTYGSLFSWPVRYLNRKSNQYCTNTLNSILNRGCVFTVTVCYSVGLSVI